LTLASTPCTLDSMAQARTPKKAVGKAPRPSRSRALIRADGDPCPDDYLDLAEIVGISKVVLPESATAEQVEQARLAATRRANAEYRRKRTEFIRSRRQRPDGTELCAGYECEAGSCSFSSANSRTPERDIVVLVDENGENVEIVRTRGWVAVGCFCAV